MVKLTSGKGGVIGSVPGVLLGIPEPSPFIAALMNFTVKQNKADQVEARAKAAEETGPTDTMSQKIKAMTLFPSIYSGPQYHRTFNNVRTLDIDRENYVADRDENDVKKATRRTNRAAGKKSNYKRPEKQKESPTDSELVKIRRLK
jgi:hypothetical protein